MSHYPLVPSIISTTTGTGLDPSNSTFADEILAHCFDTKYQPEVQGCKAVNIWSVEVARKKVPRTHFLTFATRFPCVSMEIPWTMSVSRAWLTPA
jgi:hypothetical protein